MANEFKHKDPGGELTLAEFIAACGDGHIFACQATGDIVYASSATVLSKLAKGAANTVLHMGGSCIPAWTASPSVTDLTIGGGCITLTGAATDIDLIDNNASALSFDASGKTGIIDIVTTNCSEGVTMSGTLGVTGVVTANAGVVVDNFTLDGTELDLSTGDFTLDVAGDVEINADGGCINFKDGSLALAAIVNTSCVGELRIHEAANYVGFKAPALSANQIWTLPAADGNACEVLTCNGSGVLSWAAAGGARCVAGDTDNGIITWVTSDNTFAAEAALTYDGTTLTIPGQIAFPATQSASTGANVLDCYEEGSWTPRFMDSDRDAGDENVSYGTRVARYVKIGKMVWANFKLEITDMGDLTTSSISFIGGLPFTSENTTDNMSGGIVFGGGSLNITAGYNITLEQTYNTDFAYIALWDVSTGISYALISELSADASIRAQLFYRAAA
jgi:hypothetical protein